jgi:hypothetical protein
MKLGGWLITLTAMISFLTLIGIDTGVSSILTSLGISSTGADLSGSTFYTTLIAALAVITSGAVIIGLYAKSYDTSLVILPFLLFVLGLFAKTFASIINVVSAYDQTWMTYIVVVRFAPLGIGFIISCVDYYVGR